MNSTTVLIRATNLSLSSQLLRKLELVGHRDETLINADNFLEN